MLLSNLTNNVQTRTYSPSYLNLIKVLIMYMSTKLFIPVASLILAITISVGRFAFLFANLSYTIQVKEDLVYLANERERRKQEQIQQSLEKSPLKANKQIHQAIIEDEDESIVKFKKGVVFTPTITS